MSVRPILFSAPMVRALLEGRKTQTRRLANTIGKPCIRRGVQYTGYSRPSIWQHTKPGDLLWVRESLRLGATGTAWCYSAGNNLISLEWTNHRVSQMVAWAHHKEGSSCPSIHMPRWASRLTLEVTAVKIEPLQAISSNDAEAEGIESFVDGGKRFWKRYKDGGWNTYVDCSVGSYASLWTELHGPGSWEANPEVVALTFTVHRQNVDDFLRQREAA